METYSWMVCGCLEFKQFHNDRSENERDFNNLVFN